MEESKEFISIYKVSKKIVRARVVFRYFIVNISVGFWVKLYMSEILI